MMRFYFPALVFVILMVFLWQGLQLNPQAEFLRDDSAKSVENSAANNVKDDAENNIKNNATNNVADQKFYHFDNTSDQALFDKITHELRCVVCQNQSIAESGATMAANLRQVVYESLKQNKSETEILELMRKRYGEFVLYRPPFEAQNVLLWLAPVLMLLIAVFTLKLYFIK